MTWVKGTSATNGTFSTTTGRTETVSIAVSVGEVICVAVTTAGIFPAAPPSTVIIESTLGNSYVHQTGVLDTTNNQRIDTYLCVATHASTDVLNAAFNPTPGTTQAGAVTINADPFTAGGSASSVADGTGAAQVQTAPGTGTDAVSSGAWSTATDGDLIYAATVDTQTGADPGVHGTGFTDGSVSSGATTIVLRTEFRTQATHGSISGTFTATTGTDIFITAANAVTAGSLTLAGQTGTFTEGAISRAITKALTGQTATFSEGTITASTGGNVTLSLTGQTATFAEGTLGLNIGYTLNDGVPLTGQTAAFTEGTPTGSISYTLGSQSATFTEGTIARAVSTALVGQSGTFTEGTPSAALSYPLVAQTATFTEGTISASSGGNVTLSLSGQTSTFSEGTISISGGNVTVSLTGQTATFTEGAIAKNLATAIAGQSASFTEGAITRSSLFGILGQSASFAEGTITRSQTGPVTISLTGLTATFAEGIIAISASGFRVQAVSSGYYANVYRTPGDVFDILNAADFSDSSIDYQPPSSATTGFGWMTKVSNDTPLFTWQEANNATYFPAVDPNRRFVY